MAGTRSPWMEVETPEGGFGPLSTDRSVDVAVVGGGITGITCALELVERGQSVVLLDRAEVLAGETGRTTAHCTSLVDARYSHLSRALGAQAAERVARASEDALDALEAYALKTGNPGGFQRVPAFLYSEHESALPELAREARAARQAGLDAQLTSEVPIAHASGGIRLARQAYLHPRAYLKPLLQRFLQLGGRVYENTPVLEVQDGAPCRVHTPFATVSAGSVVLATNVPLNRFFLITKLASYRTYALAFALQGAFPEGLFFDDAEPYHYVRRQPHPSGELLIVGGEDHKVGQSSDTASAFEKLEAWARERFELIEEVRYRWSGQIVESVDGLPMIGRNSGDRHVFVATGYAGNGITFGTLAGRMLAELVLGGEHPDADLFSPTRVRPRAQGFEFLRENVDSPAWFLKDRVADRTHKSVESIAPGEGRVVHVGGESLAVHRTDEGELLAVSSVCTHMGCHVHFNDAERTWDCPCHGGRFDVRGQVLNGPPRRALELRSITQGETTMATKQLNAIELLKKQHDEVEAMFEKYEKLGDSALQTKRRLFVQIADALSAHATIEERFFYPRIHEVAEKANEEADELVRESLEEHLAAKRTIADLLDLATEDEQFDAKMSVLKEMVEHHVEEEEKELFPKVKRLIDKEELLTIGAQMSDAFDELMEGEPREEVRTQTDEAPSLD